MNNSQFRKLVLDTPARQSASDSGAAESKSASKHNGTSALGSRMRSSIPMTPRSITNVDFARQVAERNRKPSGAATTKKFRSSAAPKGAVLPSGYTDRTQNRLGGHEEESSKVARVKALEEMMKLQQIDEETFVKLRDEILEDVDDIKERAGLVKGLDWRLLEKVRRGEKVDVLGGDGEGESRNNIGGEDAKEDDLAGQDDFDDEFEKLESREVNKVDKERASKKGEMAHSSLMPGKKQSRDQILAEWKAARQAAKADAQPSLGAKFKKVGASRASSRLEIDSKGREVLITVDEDGVEKRKVRRIQQVFEDLKEGNGLLMPDKDAKPLGMEVPDVPKPNEVEEEDIDIFDDAGDDYDPLGGLVDDEDSESEDGALSDDRKGKRAKISDDKPEAEAAPGAMAPPPKPNAAPASRNYFGDRKTSGSEPETTNPPALTDSTLLAALKKASTLNPISRAVENDEEAAKEARRKKMLQREDRDAEDMDLGFGSSRFEDEEDFEEKKVKLSAWGGEDGDADGIGRGDGKGKRKRGPKKRKGDANSAGDVMRIVEERKKGEGSGK